MLTKVLAFCVVTVVAADRFMTACPISCENGGTCLQSDDGNIRCLCPTGYVGVSCGARVGTACDSYPCLNGFTCSPVGTSDYACGCSINYGKNCQHPSKKRATTCSTLTCPNSQRCVMETVICKRDPCPPVATCVDKTTDGCMSSPCQNGGLCTDSSHHSYLCTCLAGFIGVNCEIKFDF